MPNRGKVFFIFIIVAIFCLGMLPSIAFSYSSPDIPVGHWSYESVERLAMGGLLGLSGLDTRPMTRVQMAYKIKEAMDNIDNEELPLHLCLDREHVEYLQKLLYKLIDEFRQELILIGVTTAQLENKGEGTVLDRFFSVNPVYPVEVENRYANVKGRKDILLENENGLRLEDGYNLRTRASSWVNIGNLFTLSARPALRVTESDTQLFFDEFSMKFSAFNMEIAAQKSAMWWGSGYHGSMLLSNNAKPLKLVRLRTVNNFRFPWVFAKVGTFGGNFFISKLEEDRVIPKPTFMGLRLEWSPIPCLAIGATRTDICGGKGRPKLRLKDYWKIFVGRGDDEFSSTDIKRTDTDQLASFDARFVLPLSPEARIASGLEVYGEWAGEDRFSFWENESPGFVAGFFLTDLFRDKGTDFRFEYAKNKPAWYIHGIYNASDKSTLAYTYQGEIMGHHMGSDADDLFFRISKTIAFLSTPYFESVKIGAQLDMERHGLSLATKEKKTEIVADILWAHAEQVKLLLRYEFEGYRNFDYVAGRYSKNHIVLVEADIDF